MIDYLIPILIIAFIGFLVIIGVLSIENYRRAYRGKDSITRN